MNKSLKKVLMGVAALAALALGGSAIAGAAGSSSTSSATAPAGQGPGPGFTAADAPGTAAHENAEKAVTGADAEKAQAAAVASVSGGKAGAVTTDFRNTGYEVTVTKTDGTQVTVHLDSAFKVMTGPPGGGPPGGGPGGHMPPPGQVPGSGQSPYGQTAPGA